MSDTILGIIIGGAFTLGGTIISLFSNWIKESYTVKSKKADHSFEIKKEILHRKLNAFENAVVVNVELNSMCAGMIKQFSVLAEQNFEYDQGIYESFTNKLVTNLNEINKISYHPSLMLPLYLENEIESLVLGEDELKKILTSLAVFHQLGEKLEDGLEIHSEYLRSKDYPRAKDEEAKNDAIWNELIEEVSKIVMTMENIKKLTFDQVQILRTEIKKLNS